MKAASVFLPIQLLDRRRKPPARRSSAPVESMRCSQPMRALIGGAAGPKSLALSQFSALHAQNGALIRHSRVARMRCPMNWLLAWLALNAIVLVWRLEMADREGRTH